jgi:hypothetical protein
LGVLTTKVSPVESVTRKGSPSGLVLMRSAPIAVMPGGNLKIAVPICHLDDYLCDVSETGPQQLSS